MVDQSTHKQIAIEKAKAVHTWVDILPQTLAGNFPVESTRLFVDSQANIPLPAFRTSVSVFPNGGSCRRRRATLVDACDREGIP